MSLTFDSWLMLYVFMGVNALSCIIGIMIGVAHKRHTEAAQQRLIESQRALIARYEETETMMYRQVAYDPRGQRTIN